jgi:hypothetical protein
MWSFWTAFWTIFLNTAAQAENSLAMADGQVAQCVRFFDVGR